MGKYGEAALMAVQYIYQEEAGAPLTAWNKAVGKVYPDSRTSREKGCPKGAFLGLCENGEIKGISAGKYLPSLKKENKNK